MISAPVQLRRSSPGPLPNFSNCEKAWKQQQLQHRLSKEDLNKMCRRLAVLLHPHMTIVRGADEKH